MSVPYGGTVMTAGPSASAGRAGRPGHPERTGPSGRRRPMLTAALGAACISSSAILVTLAHVGSATTAFFRCALALPVLALLAMVEQRRLRPRPLSSPGDAAGAGL